MKKLFVWICAGIIPVTVLSQVGHIMPGIGAVNMSMGGASTAQPIEISGALQWNPAAITVFNKNEMAVNAGLFFSSPELSSRVTTPGGVMQGTTLDDRGVSIMPAIAVVWGKKESKHHWGFSAFGVSGFGVTFPESQTNPINMPQAMGGFGKIKSDYQLMQLGITYAYKVSDVFSIGVTPTCNIATLSLEPNPIAAPSSIKGYPVSNQGNALGIGAQFGIYYANPNGLKFGTSYKTQQYFTAFQFQNKYIDGSLAPSAKFTMNYPAIFSLGFGYSNKSLDFALDYRRVNYENTTGFDKKGWTPTASVAGFGWKNIDVISAGLQYKGIKKLPVRLGYTYGSNPIDPQLAFFSTPATAIIKNAFQIGFGYEINTKCTLNAVFHSGNSNGSTSGPLLSPMMISAANPYGSIPGSQVSYKMSTALLMFGLNYKF